MGHHGLIYLDTDTTAAAVPRPSVSFLKINKPGDRSFRARQGLYWHVYTIFSVETVTQAVSQAVKSRCLLAMNRY